MLFYSYDAACNAGISCDYRPRTGCAIPCMPRSNCCCSSTIPAKRTYNGSRWQPNRPLPPQLRLGVSCIDTVSDGPPEVLGRNAFTVMGIWAVSAPMHAKSPNATACLCILTCSRCSSGRPMGRAGDNSLLHSARQLLPPGSACHCLSSRPSQTWLCYRPPSILPSPLGYQAPHH